MRSASRLNNLLSVFIRKVRCNVFEEQSSNLHRLNMHILLLFYVVRKLLEAS